MRLFPITLAVLAAGTFTASAKADDEPKRSPELNVLNHFIGTWDVQFVGQPTDGDKITFKSVSRRNWSRGGQFIRFEDPPGEQQDNPEFHMLLTYDSKANKYPGVIMMGPARSDITGTWDGKSNAMSFNIKPADGTVVTVTHRFVAEDRAEVSGEYRNSDGQLLMKASWNQSRRKKAE